MPSYEIITKESGTYINTVSYIYEAANEAAALEAWEGGKDPVDIYYLGEDQLLPDSIEFESIAKA